ATMGITVAVFQGILGDPGITFWLAPMLFVILVALGADYNIFIMSRIREEADAGHEIHHAVSRGLSLTGRVITSAGIILAGTFAALLLAPLPNLRQIGFGVTLGILIDTFVVRSLLVPAATMVVGKWAFWPRIPEPGASDEPSPGVVAGPATIDLAEPVPDPERELVLRSTSRWHRSLLDEPPPCRDHPRARTHREHPHPVRCVPPTAGDPADRRSGDRLLAPRDPTLCSRRFSRGPPTLTWPPGEAALHPTI